MCKTLDLPYSLGYMSHFLNQLNPAQREAAACLQGPQLILAGAGTGKTRVMTYRIAHMLAGGIPPEQIVAVTFTNKAAAEMRERVAALVGRQASQAIQISTFHSFCLKILRQFTKYTYLHRGFAILDTTDQIDMVRRAMADLHLQANHQPMDYLIHISQAKNALLSVAALNADPSLSRFPDPELLAMVYENYQKHLQFNNVIDFDDCIFLVHQLLQEQSEVRSKLRDQIQYLMVDEFQDTNAAQLELIRQLAHEKHNVCVVGDDDQSIYSWRGAMYETIGLFEQYFPNLKITRLEQNYRCSNVILNAANSVIKNNPVRKAKTLWSDSPGAEPIKLTRYLDEVAEANGISERILGLHGKGLESRDIAILVRSSTQTKAIELALRDLRIPYKIYGGQSFFEKKEVKDFLGYLRLVLNPRDRLAFYRVINCPSRGIGIRTLEKIHQFSQEHNVPPLKAALDPALQIAPATRAVIHEFHEKIHALHVLHVLNPQDLELLGQKILKEFRPSMDIEHKVKNPESRQQRLELIRSLPAWIAQAGHSYLEHHHGRWDPAELLQNLLLDQTQGPDKKGKNSFEERQHVAVMTIHGAKGLEFPYVFICGLEDDLLPHKNSQGQAEQICEERRLMYVAITRAKRGLFLSHCHYRNIRKQKVSKIPSRFLKELPMDEHLVIEDAGQKHSFGLESQEQRVQSTLSRLANLRSSLL